MKAKKKRSLNARNPATPGVIEPSGRDWGSNAERMKLVTGPSGAQQASDLDIWRDSWQGGNTWQQAAARDRMHAEAQGLSLLRQGFRFMDPQRRAELANLGGRGRVGPHRIMTSSDISPAHLARTTAVRRIESINQGEKARQHPGRSEVHQVLFSAGFERFF